MDVETKAAMTVEQFLAWDDQQEGRHEFDGRDVIEVVGGTWRHERIVANLLRILGNLLFDTPFVSVASGFRLRAGPAVRLPDVQVYRDGHGSRATLADNPIVVFEVLSSSTARTDRIKKSSDYWRTPSIAHFVLIEQRFVGATILTRGADGWVARSVDEGGAVDLPALGLSIPIVDLYWKASAPEAEDQA